MQLYPSIEELPEDFRAGAVTIGNFDGVHRGHAQLIARVVARAKEFDGPAVVFTFEPHPVRLLRPEEAPAPLTWVDRKAELLAKLNVDAVVAFPTTREFLSLTPDEYFQQVVRDQLRTRAIVEGPNFFFGKNRAGDIETLKMLCERHDIALEIVEPIRQGEEFVSSSRVRTAIAAGDVGLANEMLTRPYRVRGMVTHGAGRGATIGFPTANLSAVDTLLPGPGVYSGVAHHDGKAYRCAVNIGPNPTFGEDLLKVEVHLLDFKQSIYGQPLEVDFVHKLRDVFAFGSLDELKHQLSRDIEQARQIDIE